MFTVIINPISGSGRSVALLGRVCAELQSRGLSHEVATTEYPGHATQLAQAAQHVGSIVVMGGDGTLSEVANGLDSPHVAVYFVPCGTGNDFVKTLKYPKDPIDAFRHQLDGAPIDLDLPSVNGRRFLNVSGTGFDIEVLRQTEKYKARHRGLVAYLLGIFLAIRHFSPVKARISFDGGAPEEHLLTIIEVANGQYIGGGMRVAPTADPSDGLFDVVCVKAVRKWQICMLLPLFIPGWFVKLPIAHVRRARSVTIESPGMTLNIDGELLDTDRATYTLTAGAVTART